MITLSEKAVQEIKRIIAEQPEENIVLRVAVRGGGCSGLAWKLELDPTKPTEKDFLLEQDGVKIAVDARSVLYVDGLTIDYIDEMGKRGFLVDNPMMSTKCGCGSACH